MSNEPSRTCISCKKTITVHTHYINGATEFIGSPGYGSGFDSITQERSKDWPEWGDHPDVEVGETRAGLRRQLTLVICDNCLATEVAPYITVVHRTKTEKVLTQTTMWADSDHPQKWLDYKAAEKKKVHLLLDARTLCGLLPSDTEESLTVVGAVGAHEGQVTCDTCLDEWDAMKCSRRVTW